MTTPTDSLGIEPLAGPIDADVALPGSKSLSNRALAVAALAHGTSELVGVLDADDTASMIECLEKLGAQIRHEGESHFVTGVGGMWRQGPITLDVRRAATVARFLLPSLLLGLGAYEVKGNPQISRRPMEPLFDALRDLGLRVKEDEAKGRLPAHVIAGGPPSAQARADVTGHVSSQFLSGLLLAAPCFPGGLTAGLNGSLVSRPYIDMTTAIMRYFGATVDRPDDATFVVAPGGYKASRYVVEPDASGASYFFAAAAICGGSVRVHRLGRESLQGDLQFVRVLEKMGADVRVGTSYVEVKSSGRLHGVPGGIDMSDFSDTAQTLAMVAAFADSPTHVSGIGFIRGKETDRIGHLVAQLNACGVDASEEPDGFTVRPSADAIRPARVETYDDHRMAMSFALLGLRRPGIEILDPGCVSKTFPRYFDVLEGLRIARR